MIILRMLLRLFFISIKYLYYKKLMKMDISPSSRISFGARLDLTYPKGVHIGDESYIASGAIIFTHDYSRSIKADTYVGKRCFIGANAIIMPGVCLGDEIIVGCGAVVTKNVPSNSIVAGNPAKIIRTGIRTSRFGSLEPSSS